MGDILWAQQNIPPTPLLLFKVGLLIIFLPLVVFGLCRFIRKMKKQLMKPESLIFPYIKTIDASQIKQQKSILYVWYCFPSALNYDLIFMKSRCKLDIDYSATTEQEMSPITIIKHSHNEIPCLEIVLGDKITAQSKDNLMNKAVMRFRLYVTCWDDKGKVHDLSTKEHEMIAIP